MPRIPQRELDELKHSVSLAACCNRRHRLRNHASRGAVASFRPARVAGTRLAEKHALRGDEGQRAGAGRVNRRVPRRYLRHVPCEAAPGVCELCR